MEDILNSVSGEEMSNDSVDYISAINEIKQNSVSKEAYEKLKADNKRLLDAVVSGKEIEIEAKPQKTRQEALEGWTKEDVSNIDFFQNLLDYRDICIAETEIDPALSIGNKVNGVDMTPEKADEIAQFLREQLEVADGDNAIFTREYQRLIKDTAIPRPNSGKRR